MASQLQTLPVPPVVAPPEAATNPAQTSRVRVQGRDPQEQASGLGQLHQSYEQLSSGVFSGSLLAICSQDITVFRETLDQSVFQTGVSDPGHITIAAACELSERAYWNGRYIDRDSVVAFTPGREFELRTPTHAVCVGISLNPAVLHSLAPERPPEFWEKRFASHDCWSEAGHLKFDLQNRISGLLGQAGEAVSEAACLSELLDLRERAIDYLGEVLERGESGGQKLRADSYPRIAKRARAAMLERLGEPISVTDLCAELGCSRRSLQYAFESIYNLGPVAYLRTLRLAAARKALTSGHADTTVQDVAAAVGFSHLPRFAQEYARMFGERPSESLAQHRAIRTNRTFAG